MYFSYDVEVTATRSHFSGNVGPKKSAASAFLSDLLLEEVSVSLEVIFSQKNIFFISSFMMIMIINSIS